MWLIIGQPRMSAIASKSRCTTQTHIRRDSCNYTDYASAEIQKRLYQLSLVLYHILSKDTIRNSVQEYYLK